MLGTHTMEGANVQYKTHFRSEITLHVAQIINTAATLYTLEIWFVSGI
jgi:hypothetical protein